MDSGQQGGRVVCCPQCGRTYRLPPSTALSPGLNLRCTGCGRVFPLEKEAGPDLEPEGPRILVASDGSELRGIVEQVLLSGGYKPQSAHGGDDAWRLIVQWRPQATVLDVGLPGMPVFEICERVRKDPNYQNLGIILLASVYQHTRYKRSPTSLYGADDYIEKHHLRDSLLGKIARVLPEKRPSAAEGRSAYPPPVREEAPREGRTIPDPVEARKDKETMVREEHTGPAPAGQVDDARQERLRRFARIIASDIALYNQDVIEKGIREGSVHQRLAKEVEEGQRLYQSRLAPGAGREKNFFRQAISELFEKQKTRFLEEGGAGDRG